MNEKKVCLGHENGFQHLEVKPAGQENEYDLGFKLEEKESDSYSIDSITGIKVWAEPELVLYISVKDLRRGNPNSLTLHYALTRSEFANKLSAGDADRDELLKRAMPRLRADLKSLRDGANPLSLDRIVML
jgi:hypothetical protein